MKKSKTPPNKSKILFGIGISILFVILGLSIFMSEADNQVRINPTFVKIVAAAVILFFGVTGIYGIVKFISKKDAS